MKALILSAQIANNLARASFVAQAMCGVINALGCAKRGLSSEGGSAHITSAPYPPNCPFSKASATSASLMSCPRPVFTNKAPFFILFSVALFIISKVSAVKGQCKERISLAANKPSSVVFWIPSGKSAEFLLVKAKTSMPKSRAILATLHPMFPKPTMPKVLPLISRKGVSQ